MDQGQQQPLIPKGGGPPSAPCPKPAGKPWATRLFKGARVIVDSMPQCISKGETWNALHEGIITQQEIAGELGQVLLGQLPGRTSDQEITIFDTTGTAMQDNTTAFSIYHRALEKGLGRYFDFYSLG